MSHILGHYKHFELLKHTAFDSMRRHFIVFIGFDTENTSLIRKRGRIMQPNDG